MDDLSEPAFKKMKPNQKEAEESRWDVMNDLPELPFRLILSYLSLEDRIKSRAVSRKWCKTIDQLKKVKCLCYSERSIGHILDKRRWISGAFIPNFISSRKTKSFFQTFGPSILVSLKHIRLCDFRLDSQTTQAVAQTLNSFGRLQELDIIRFVYNADYHLLDNSPKIDLELNLPMLNSIRLEAVLKIDHLTLNAPKLTQIKLSDCCLSLDIVHPSSVERLLIDRLEYVQVRKLKNLKYLYLRHSSDFDSTLSTLDQLKEFHLMIDDHNYVSQMFRERYGSADLKIFLCGLLLNGLDDPAIETLSDYLDEETIDCLVANSNSNPSRLADQIPFCTEIGYPAIEFVPRESEIDFFKRFTDLNEIRIFRPVEDIERFLDLLKHLANITKLVFYCGQQPDLFDRLPDHCAALQSLNFWIARLDFRFLFKLKHLTHLRVGCSIDAGLIRKIFEEQKFLLLFQFKFLSDWVTIEMEPFKQFEVSVKGKKTQGLPDLNAVIRFIVENATEE